MNIITVGIDLAKNVFAVHGVDETGKPALVKPKVGWGNLFDLIVQLPPCVIGMEACSGAHHWTRLFRQYGHTVKLMAAEFVTPYRKSAKSLRGMERSGMAIRWGAFLAMLWDLVFHGLSLRFNSN
jgi:transposase